MRRPVGFSFPLKYKIKLSAISPRKYKGLENQGRKKHPQSRALFLVFIYVRHKCHNASTFNRCCYFTLVFS